MEMEINKTRMRGSLEGRGRTQRTRKKNEEEVCVDTEMGEGVRSEASVAVR